MDEADAAFFVPHPVAHNYLQDIPREIRYFLRNYGISQGFGDDLVGYESDYPGFSASRDTDRVNCGVVHRKGE